MQTNSGTYEKELLVELTKMTGEIPEVLFDKEEKEKKEKKEKKREEREEREER